MQALTWDLLRWFWPLDCRKQMPDWDQFAGQWLKGCWEKYKQTKCTANTSFWKANELWWTQGHIGYHVERPAPACVWGRGDGMVFSQLVFPLWHGGDPDHDLQSPRCICRACTCDICEENLCVTLAILFFLSIAWKAYEDGVLMTICHEASVLFIVYMTRKFMYSEPPLSSKVFVCTLSNQA